MKCKDNKEHDFQYNRLRWKYECINCSIAYDIDKHSLKDTNDSTIKTSSTPIDKR